MPNNGMEIAQNDWPAKNQTRFCILSDCRTDDRQINQDWTLGAPSWRLIHSGSKLAEAFSAASPDFCKKGSSFWAASLGGVGCHNREEMAEHHISTQFSFLGISVQTLSSKKV